MALASRTLLATVLALVMGAASAAYAQDPPKFEYGKKEEVKGVEWKASAQAGLNITTGNSRTTTLAAGGLASRKAGDNKFTLEVALAYTRSELFIASDTNGTPGIGPDEIQRIEQTTAKSSLLKTRYDRFLSEKNSLYVTARVGADEPAGKELVFGGQLGYSRLLVKTKQHELVSEVGYDFSYENYVAAGDPLNIHSARAFVGYTGSVSGKTALTASGEFLTNVNEEKAPGGDIAPLEDNRLIGKVALTATLWKNVSFRFGFTAKFDAAPAPRAPFAGAAYEMGFTPLADELDTMTELTLIVNFI